MQRLPLERLRCARSRRPVRKLAQGHGHAPGAGGLLTHHAQLHGHALVAGLTADATRGGRYHGDQDGPGWGEHSYNNRIRTERQRHLEAAAQQLLATARDPRSAAPPYAATQWMTPTTALTPDGGVQLPRRDDLVDEPDLQRPCDGDPATEHDHLLRAGLADEAGQPLRPAGAWHDAEAHLGEPDLAIQPDTDP